MSSQLQILSNQFNALLVEYKDTYNNYVNVLNAKDNSFTHAKDFSFIGKSNLSVLGSYSASSCETECSKNSSCDGATFNSTLNNCTLGSGPGTMVHTINSVAIVKKALYYSNRLKDMNAEMIALNEKMISLSSNNYQYINQSEVKQTKQNEIMMNNHNVLLGERSEIERMIRQFQTIDAAYKDGNIIADANYSSYIILICIAIFLIFVLMGFAFTTPQYGGGHRQSNNYMVCIVVSIIFFIIIVNAIIKRD
jgi:hypothetical protein